MKNQILKKVLDGAIVMALLAAMAQTVRASGPPLPGPDAASTAGLMAVACGALLVVRNRIRR